VKAPLVQASLATAFQWLTVGKTWLACALAQSACRSGTTVLYKRLPRLFDELELVHGPSRQIASC